MRHWLLFCLQYFVLYYLFFLIYHNSAIISFSFIQICRPRLFNVKASLNNESHRRTLLHCKEQEQINSFLGRRRLWSEEFIWHISVFFIIINFIIIIIIASSSSFSLSVITFLLEFSFLSFDFIITKTKQNKNEERRNYRFFGININSFFFFSVHHCE